MERLDKHFKQLTRAVYERHGRAFGEVLLNWPVIAGERLAQWTEPERVLWPRLAFASQKLGGTLVVKCVPQRALDVQYETPLLLERINQYFGYGAINAIRIVQGPVSHGRSSRSKIAESVPDDAVSKQVAGITDDRLKVALSKLGAGLKSRKSTASRT